MQNNNLQMIVRAHECVMDGFERFAQGHLITLFSATNYCGTAGAWAGVHMHSSHACQVRVCIRLAFKPGGMQIFCQKEIPEIL